MRSCPIHQFVEYARIHGFHWPGLARNAAKPHIVDKSICFSADSNFLANFEIEYVRSIDNEHARVKNQPKKIRFVRARNNGAVLLACRRIDLRLWMVVIVIAHKYYFIHIACLPLVSACVCLRSNRTAPMQCMRSFFLLEKSPSSGSLCVCNRVTTDSQTGNFSVNHHSFHFLLYT